MKDFTKSEKFPDATKDDHGRLMVGAAVGVGADAKRRAQALIDAGSTSWSSTRPTATPSRCWTWWLS